MKKTKFLALLMAVAMIVVALSACAPPVSDSSSGTSTSTPAPAEDQNPQTPSDKTLEPIIVTMFVAGPGEPPPKDNKIVKRFRKSQGHH